MKENVLFKASGVKLVLDGIAILIMIFYFLPVGIHMIYTGIIAFREYGFKKLPNSYTVFYMGRVKYAYEIFLIGFFYFTVSVWYLFFKDGGVLFLWIDYLYKTIVG